MSIWSMLEIREGVMYAIIGRLKTNAVIFFYKYSIIGLCVSHLDLYYNECTYFATLLPKIIILIDFLR